MTKAFSNLRVRLILLVLLATLPALVLTAYNGSEQRHLIEDLLRNSKPVIANQLGNLAPKRRMYVLGHMLQRV